MILPVPLFQSVRGREGVLAETLRAFHAEWPVYGPGATVVVDPRQASPLAAPATARQIADTFERVLLTAARTSYAQLFLLMEDDVRFAPGFAARLAEFLEAAPAVRLRRAFAMSLYRCDLEDVGNQALVLTRPVVEYAIERWRGLGMDELAADKRVRKCAREMALAFPVLPLVQHVGRESTYGNGFHYDERFPWPDA